MEPSHGKMDQSKKHFNTPDGSPRSHHDSGHATPNPSPPISPKSKQINEIFSSVTTTTTTTSITAHASADIKNTNRQFKVSPRQTLPPSPSLTVSETFNERVSNEKISHKRQNSEVTSPLSPHFFDSSEGGEGTPLRFLRRTHSKSLPPSVSPMEKKDSVIRIHSTHDLSVHIPSPRNALELLHRRAQVSPKRSSDSSTDLCIELKKKDAIEAFNQSVLDYLTHQWRYSKKEKILETIQHKTRLICKEEVYRVMDSRGIHDFDSLHDTVHKKAPFLLRIIQTSEVLFEGINARLKLFSKLIKRWQTEGHVKTKWSDSFRLKIKELSKIKEQESESDNTDISPQKNARIAAFFHQFKFLKQTECPATYKFLQNAFGDTPNEIKDVKTLLKTWGAPNYNTAAALENLIQDACIKNILTLSQPFKKHTFPLNEKDREQLYSIQMREMYRCILQGGVVLYNKIIFKGTHKRKDSVFHEHVKPNPLLEKMAENFLLDQTILNSSTTSSSSEESQKDISLIFWESFLAEIYSQFKNKISSEDIQEQAKFICENEFTAQSPPDLASRLPCHLIIKCLSMSCWSLGDLRFRSFFEPFFKTIYWSRLQQGMECSITIHSLTKFEISQTKTYRLYPRLNPHDPRSHIIDENHPIAHIPFTTTISVSGKRLQGSIEIKKEDFKILDQATPEEKWFVYETLTNLSQVALSLALK